MWYYNIKFIKQWDDCMEEELNLSELISVLKKHLLKILLFAVVAAILVGVVSLYILEKEYTASTTIMIGKPKNFAAENQISYEDLRLNQQLVSTYSELIKTRRVVDQVIKDLNLQISYEAFRGKVKVNSLNNTELMQIQVTDESPEQAAEIANYTSEIFADTVQDVFKVENIQVIDTASTPTSATSPRPLLNIAVATVLAVMIGVFLAFLMEFLDNTVKTSEDIEKHLQLPVIGMIPKINE